MDRREILIPAPIRNVNHSNEQYITLTQGCIRGNILSRRFYWPEPQHPWFKTTTHTRAEEPLNKIATLKSSEMLQNWNLIERYSIPSALVRYSFRFLHAYWCYSDKFESSSCVLWKTVITTHMEKKNESSPILHYHRRYYQA